MTERSGDPSGTVEEALTGAVGAIARVGTTVRRSVGPWTPAVHTLLGHVERAGFDGAPRALGFDEQGREILSYIEGDVASGATPAAFPDEILVPVGRLIRRVHAATAGFTLPDGARWHHPPVTDLPGLEGTPMVVCHNDLSPRNTVLASHSGRPVAFIDWDFASLAPAVWDVAHAAWQFVPLAPDATCAALGWPEPPDRPRRLRTLVEGYGLDGLSDAARDRFVEIVARRIERTASGIERLAARGEPPYQRLVHDGAVAAVRADGAWVATHAAALDAVLR